MNRAYTIFGVLIFSMLVASSCKKLAEPPSLDDINITADKETYNIGDTIVFSINKEADIISFYSGIPGFSVNHRFRDTGSGINILKFQTSLSQASRTNNGDTMLLYISTNLKSYDSIGVAQANWVNMSSFAKWPVVGSSGFINSGSVDISQFNNADSVYIAFQVLGKQNATVSQRKWQVQNLTLSNTLPDGTFTPLFAPPFVAGANLTTDTVSYFANTGWAQVNVKNNPKFSYITTNFHAWNVGEYGYNATNAPVVIGTSACNTSGVVIRSFYPLTFDPSNVKNMADNEDWLITSPVNLRTVRHDFPTAVIKNSVNTTSKGMKYIRSNGVYGRYSMVLDSTFSTGKTYDMGFVAQNLNVESKQEVIRHVYIKVN